MNSFKNALVAVLALAMVLGGAAVFWDDSSDAAALVDGAPSVDENTPATPPANIYSILDYVNDTVGPEGPLSPVRPGAPGDKVIDANQTITGDIVWTGCTVLKGDITVTFSNSATLTLDTDAELVIDGKVTFKSAAGAPFAIVMKEGASITVGNTGVLDVDASPGLEADNTVILASTGEFVLGYEYTTTEAVSAAAGADEPVTVVTKYYYEIYLDAISADLADQKSITVTYSNADGSKEVVSMAKAAGEVAEVSFSADVDFTDTYKDISARYATVVADQAAIKSFPVDYFVLDPKAVYPMIDAAVLICPYESVEYIGEDVAATTSVTMIKATAVTNVGEKTLNIIISELDYNSADYRDDKNKCQKDPQAIDSVKGFKATVSIGAVSSANVKFDSISVNLTIAKTECTVTADASAVTVTADVRAFINAFRGMDGLDSVHYFDIIDEMIEKDVRIADLFADLNLDANISGFKMKADNAGNSYLENLVLAANLSIQANYTDEEAVINGVTYAPGSMKLSATSVNIEHFKGEIDLSLSRQCRETKEAMTIGTLTAAGQIDKNLLTGLYAYSIAIDSNPSMLLDAIMKGIDIQADVAVSDMKVDVEEKKGCCSLAPDASLEAYIPLEEWDYVDHVRTSAVSVGSAAINMKVDTAVPEPVEPAPDAADAPAEPAKKDLQILLNIEVDNVAASTNTQSDAQFNKSAEGETVFDAFADKDVMNFTLAHAKLYAYINYGDILDEMELNSGSQNADPDAGTVIAAVTEETVEYPNPLYDIKVVLELRDLQLNIDSYDVYLYGDEVTPSRDITDLRISDISAEVNAQGASPFIAFSLGDFVLKESYSETCYENISDADGNPTDRYTVNGEGNYPNQDSTCLAFSGIKFRVDFDPTVKVEEGQDVNKLMYENGVALREYIKPLLNPDNYITAEDAIAAIEGLQFGAVVHAELVSAEIETVAQRPAESDVVTLENKENLNSFVVVNATEFKCRDVGNIAFGGIKADAKLDEKSVDVRASLEKLLLSREGTDIKNKYQRADKVDELSVYDLSVSIKADGINTLLIPAVERGQNAPGIADITGGMTDLDATVGFDSVRYSEEDYYTVIAELPYDSDVVADLGDRDLYHSEYVILGVDGPRSGDKAVSLSVSYHCEEIPAADAAPAPGAPVPAPKYNLSAALSFNAVPEAAFDLYSHSFYINELDVGDDKFIDQGKEYENRTFFDDLSLNMTMSADGVETDNIRTKAFISKASLSMDFSVGSIILRGLDTDSDGDSYDTTVQVDGIKFLYEGVMAKEGGFVLDTTNFTSPEDAITIDRMSVDNSDYDGAVSFVISDIKAIAYVPYSLTDAEYAFDAASFTGDALGVTNVVDGNMMCISTYISLTDDGSYMSSNIQKVNLATGEISSDATSGGDMNFLGVKLLRDVDINLPFGTINGFEVPVGTVINVTEDGRFNTVKVGDKTYGVGSSYVVKEGDAVTLVTRYQVAQDMDDDREAVYTYFEKGADIVLTAPVREGYTFAKWLNEDGTDFVTKTMPENDIVVTASWTPNEYTVKYDTVGGIAVPDQKFTFDLEAPLAAAPTKEGYQFAGWKYGSVLLGAESMFKVPAGDVSMTAVWKVVIAEKDLDIAGENVTITSDTESAEISAEALSKILTNAQVKNVNMLLGGSKVKMTSAALRSLSTAEGAEATDMSFTITTGDSLADGLQVHPDKADKYKALSFVISIDIASDGVKKDLEPVTVSIPFDASGMDIENLVVVYFNEKNGNIVELDDFSYENGMITFVTDHFSTFAVTEKVIVPPAEEEGSDNLLLIAGAIVGVLLVIVVVAVIIKRGQ